MIHIIWSSPFTQIIKFCTKFWGSYKKRRPSKIFVSTFNMENAKSNLVWFPPNESGWISVSWKRQILDKFIFVMWPRFKWLDDIGWQRWNISQKSKTPFFVIGPGLLYTITPPKWFHIILKPRNVKICEHSIFRPKMFDGTLKIRFLLLLVGHISLKTLIALLV